MNTFRWIHFTDLHCGVKDQEDYWSEIKKALAVDLKKLKKKCGEPWHAVFFTGDLTNQGSEQQFIKFNKKLAELKSIFNESDSDPQLFVIPGNHDLVRPDEDDPAVIHMNEKGLDKKYIRNEIFSGKNEHGYFNIINNGFENYTQWLSKSFHFKKPPVNKGCIPGDFSYSLKHGDYKIGIIGINTAYLQLSAGNYKGKLRVDRKQWMSICGDDYTEWFDHHDFCLIMTHHPLDWLDNKGQNEFKSMTPSERFVFHFCGHMHENRVFSTSEGGSQSFRRTIQSAALYDKSEYVVYEKAQEKEAEGKRVEKRWHGYTAGTIELQDDKIRMRYWPRRGVMKHNNKNYAFEPETAFDLDDELDDGGTVVEVIKRNKRNTKTDEIKDLDHHSYAAGAKSKIQQQIEQILSPSHLNIFRESLQKTICLIDKEIGEEYREKPAKFLCEIDSVDVAFQVLRDSIRHCINNAIGDRNIEQIKSVKDCASNIFGWLILRAVSEKWVEQHKDPSNIPVKEPLTAGIALARLKGVKTSFPQDAKKTDIKEDHTVMLEDHIPECGWDEKDQERNIKETVWTKVFPLDAPPSDNFDEKLNSYLELCRAGNERYYILVPTASKMNPLHDPVVIDKINKTLNQLDIHFFGEKADADVLTMTEGKLWSHVVKFLETIQK